MLSAPPLPAVHVCMHAREGTTWKLTSAGWRATQPALPRLTMKGLRREAIGLKEVVAEQAVELRLLKKGMTWDGSGQE